MAAATTLMQAHLPFYCCLEHFTNSSCCNQHALLHPLATLLQVLFSVAASTTLMQAHCCCRHFTIVAATSTLNYCCKHLKYYSILLLALSLAAVEVCKKKVRTNYQAISCSSLSEKCHRCKDSHEFSAAHIAAQDCRCLRSTPSCRSA